MSNPSMQLQDLAACELAGVRVTGPYGQGYEAAIQHLMQWVHQHGVATREVIFIYHDDPNTTAPEQCRTDCCITLAEPEAVALSESISRISLPGGRYATLRCQIASPEQYGAAWQQLMQELEQAGLQWDERPCFELYHHSGPQAASYDVSICIPVR